jgi:ethanolamine ammonia-lyase small subunit
MSSLTRDIDAGWQRLRAATPARICLARSGSSIATQDHLAFQLDHARARDAVNAPFDTASLAKGLAERGLECIHLHSAAADRRTYLARPDLGRRLDDRSRDLLRGISGAYDLLFVLADGLSAGAVTSHALPVLNLAVPELARRGWKIGPVVLVDQGRVAIGDEIGQSLRATLVAVLIGERPGLTSSDSLGIYLTWNPVIGRTDAERNCLSSIRPEGLPYADAVGRLLYLAKEAKRRRCTGIALKDESSLSLLSASPPD